MNKTWKAVLGVIVIFLLGGAFGGLCATLVIWHKSMSVLNRGSGAMADVIEHRMGYNLSLDADQRAKVHAILVQNLSQRQALQKQIMPQVQALNRTTMEQIDAVLRPEQQQRLTKEIQLFKSRFNRSPLNPAGDDSTAVPLSDADTKPAPPPQ